MAANWDPWSEITVFGNPCNFQIWSWYKCAKPKELVSLVVGIMWTYLVKWSHTTNIVSYPCTSGRPATKSTEILIHSPVGDTWGVSSQNAQVGCYSLRWTWYMWLPTALSTESHDHPEWCLTPLHPPMSQMVTSLSPSRKTTRKKRKQCKWKKKIGWNLKSKISMARKKSIVDIKNEIEWNSTNRCPSQCLKGPTQVGKARVLIPVKFQDWRCRSRGRDRSRFPEGNSDNWYVWSYTRWVTLSDKQLGRNVRWQSWMKKSSRQRKLWGGSLLSCSLS